MGFPFFFDLNPNLFFDLGAHAKFQKPTIAPSSRKVSQAEKEREEEREKNAVKSGHLVPWQRTQAAQTNLFFSLFLSFYLWQSGFRLPSHTIRLGVAIMGLTLGQFLIALGLAQSVCTFSRISFNFGVCNYGLGFVSSLHSNTLILTFTAQNRHWNSVRNPKQHWISFAIPHYFMLTTYFPESKLLLTQGVGQRFL